ncbi:mechanosensitive ion channel family protein [Chitinilyticum litopenaei]|uniref:mechanosensitive ion channel family protein n=1 Tax=Chitinilyticum litopenaei TaxID=1121276 RepID=UPI0004218B33|nr:mechanosensitive ion channel family protein [Chitinilyticum litopenaei]
MDFNFFTPMLSKFLPAFIDKALLQDLVATLIFIVLLLILRSSVRHAILRRDDLSPDTKRRWLITVRNSALLVFLLGIALIWAQQIETLAVSMVAIAAAFVIAHKELILCMLGSIYRTSTHAFQVGDRIEIKGMKGLVLDTRLLATTLLESSHAGQGKGTVGRTLTIPNSLLLSEPVFNETRLGSYVIQTIHIELPRAADWEAAESVLLAAAGDIVAAYAEDLERHRRDIEQGFALESPSLTPRVRLSLDEHETITLHLQLPVPLGQRARVEQDILRHYLRATTTAGKVQ